MQALQCLVYVSSAAQPFTQQELEALLEQARTRNTADDITGLLLYSGGNFMQLLEGPPDAVRQTFARVSASRRHRQVIELMNEPVAAREFSDWSMGFAQASAPQFLSLQQAHWPAEGPGRGLMRQYWQSMR
jgi:hypothetical protein